MSRLANYLGYRGSSASAMELQQRVLDALERAQMAPSNRGRLRPPAAASQGGPGRRGTRPRPRDQYAALLPVMERVLGPEHRHTSGCPRQPR